MGHRRDRGEDFPSESGIAFAILVAGAGFSGPEKTDNGVLFHSAGLDVEVCFLDGREPVVTTLVAPIGLDGVSTRGAWLVEVYVAGGRGPAQDVPGSAPTRRALKRVHQQAAALRQFMPRLLTAEGGSSLPDVARAEP
ncbi:hypothetical protein [Streptomyces canus]|uniref:hypothetical protein n=1 Tax=Streptomyces canus TaxID=58343 RepID=UPI0033B62BBF